MRTLIFLVAFISSSALQAAQGIPQIPQIPAFLPMAHTVPMRDASPIDGEWMITSIGKRVRIQGGRAYALDPWLHMFVLQVKPMMVVLSEITTTDGQNYVGKDLPLLGTWNAVLDRDGMLNATVQTMVGPIRYAMMPVRMDDQRAYEQAKRGRYEGGAPGYEEYDEYEEEYAEEDYYEEDGWDE
ncbi:MAG: hypothetical protein AAF541_06105 [Pseudomonadota bacterium]